MSSQIPEIIYKYRDWNNQFHKRILLHNEIYLTSPSEFNDPFDCKIPRNFLSLKSSEIEEFQNKLAQKRYAENPSINYGEQLFQIKTHMSNIKDFQGEDEKAYFKILNENYGIFSLSTTFNVILLWSHYANNHQGFCVGFKEEKLRYFGGFVRTGIVAYQTDFPQIKPKAQETKEEKYDRIRIQTTTKSEDWKYEQEYRLIKAFVKPPLPFERCNKVPDVVFSDVTLGINISPDNKEEIIEICSKKNIPVYQAKKVPFKFEIDRDLIEKKWHH